MYNTYFHTNILYQIVSLPFTILNIYPPELPHNYSTKQSNDTKISFPFTLTLQDMDFICAI